MAEPKARRKKKTVPKLRKNQWTTLEQQAWLTEHVPTYVSIPTDPSMNYSSFWAQLYEPWFEKWPIIEPTDEQEKLEFDKAEAMEAAKKVTSLLCVVMDKTLT
jgi:hypothetical protein